MRLRARMSLALFGLALAVPTAATAQGPAQPGASGGPHRHTKGLFGNKRSCTECQVKELAAKGIHVPPPPPPIPDGAIVSEGECTACQSAPMVSGPMTSRVAMRPAMRSSAGRPRAMRWSGERSLRPSRRRSAWSIRASLRASRRPPPAVPGTMDRSLTPTSMAPNPIRPKTHNDPRVLSHLLGLSDLRPRSACGPGGQGARGARQDLLRPDQRPDERGPRVGHLRPSLRSPRPHQAEPGPGRRREVTSRPVPRAGGLAPDRGTNRPMDSVEGKGDHAESGPRGASPRSPGLWSRSPQDAGMVRAQESTSPAAARSYSGHSRRDPPNDDKGVTMRFGNWRGVTLALALGSALATIPTTAFANPFHHDIPREVRCGRRQHRRPVLCAPGPLRPLRRARTSAARPPGTGVSAASAGGSMAAGRGRRARRRLRGLRRVGLRLLQGTWPLRPRRRRRGGDALRREGLWPLQGARPQVARGGPLR